MYRTDILNEAALVAQRDRWFDRLQGVFDGTYREPIAFVLDGVRGRGVCDPYAEPERWVDECMADIAANRAALAANEEKFVPVCVEFGLYGVHYIDRIFGSNVYFKSGQWYNDYLTTPIGELRDPDLEHDETFQLSLRAARRFAEVGGELTLFGLPTIASTLNIAINLYGQEILMRC